jgi:hypothetical protein
MGCGASQVDPAYDLKPKKQRGSSAAVEDVVARIAEKLELPNKVQASVVKTLHQNAIYVITPLANYKDSDWEALDIPVPVRNELRAEAQKSAALNSTLAAPVANSEGARHAINELEKHRRRAEKPQGETIGKSGLSSDEEGERLTPCQYCGRKFLPRKMKHHEPQCRAEKTGLVSGSNAAGPNVHNPSGDQRDRRKLEVEGDAEGPQLNVAATPSHFNAHAVGDVYNAAPTRFQDGDINSQKAAPKEEVPDDVPVGSSTKTFPNGDKYSGQVNSVSKAHGKGTYWFANGDVYEGQFSRGNFHGVGSYKMVNGDHYEGGFVDDEFSGEGTLTKANGEVYTGEFLHGKFHGRGKFEYANGNVYQGEFEHGQIEGDGSYTFEHGDVFLGRLSRGKFVDGQYAYKNGDRYVGQYKGTSPHGTGKLIYSSGNIYEGGFMDGQRHGKGTFTYADGIRKHVGTYLHGKREGPGQYVDQSGTYEGEFKDGAIAGRGVFKFVNGNLYEGDFDQNMFHGHGKMVESDATYVGEWVYGVRHGYGEWTLPTSEAYKGQWHENSVQGKGTYMWANGNMYAGAFQRGKPHGAGRFTLTETSEVVDGQFVDGVPVDNPGGVVMDTISEKVASYAGKKGDSKVAVKITSPFLAQHQESLF